MAVEQAVDEMQVPRPAAAGTYGEFAGQMRFRASREGRHLLMAHMHPLDLRLTTNGIGQAVETVANNAINSFDACCRESLSKLVCNTAHVIVHRIARGCGLLGMTSRSYAKAMFARARPSLTWPLLASRVGIAFSLAICRRFNAQSRASPGRRLPCLSAASRAFAPHTPLAAERLMQSCGREQSPHRNLLSSLSLVQCRLREIVGGSDVLLNWPSKT